MALTRRSLLLSALAQRPANRLNIIVILADDFGDNPDSKIPTPNIDRLAKEGTRFLDASSPTATAGAPN